jgi:hypothetical protein
LLGKGPSTKRSSTKAKDVDWEIARAENPELVEMVAVTKIWSTPSTKSKHLKRLHEQHLLPEQRLGRWEALREHQVPALRSSQIVLLIPFVEHGLCLPTCPFLHGFLYYYGINLNHLNPNSILHLSVFVHLYETFLGILPSITLFRYFFRLKPHPNTASPHVLGGVGIQFHLGKKQEYVDYSLVDSMKDWRAEWFFAENILLALVVRDNTKPSVNNRWEKETLASSETEKIKPFMKVIKSLKI